MYRLRNNLSFGRLWLPVAQAFLFAGALTSLLLAVDYVNGHTVFSVWQRFTFIALVLLISWGARVLRLPSLLALSAAISLGVSYQAGWQNVWLAWGGLGLFFVGLLLLDSEFDSPVPSSSVRNRGTSLARLLFLTSVGSLLPTLLEQKQSRFSAEEFFVFGRAVLLGGFCLAVLFTFRYICSHQGRPPPETFRQRKWRAYSVAILAFVSLAGMVQGVITYQHSFFPPVAPAFAGISEAQPFLCGRLSQMSPATVTPAGDVFGRIIRAIAANPHKSAPEYGMLALATQDGQWAQQFRTALLAEAAAEKFTAPANSVKSTQYEAALRVYYTMKVRKAFPTLFSEDDMMILRPWFAAINRRALTTEWVDWMYGLAFSRWPEGPYENQENGAGLLALLEVSGLRSEELSPENRAYLQRNPRGWQARFRNTDDAYVYEPEWINNAYFQSLYYKKDNARHIQQSFRWLLLQALPDGNRVGYNHPARANLAALFYWGANLLHDPSLLWVAEQEITNLEARGGYLPAQPGTESSLTLKPTPPTEGSCLLYGDSGLPNQRGPLAPDKIVLRDQWAQDGMYALINLRFTGWHRYKATNALVLLYHQTPLVMEQSRQQPFSWLPVGRSLFRDKRIPREFLNGLLVPSPSLGNALWTLTGIGSMWAQDPPYYAGVESFETLGPLDVSRTRLANWHGWSQTRTLYFFHGGPLFVVDHATNDAKQGHAAIIWHTGGKGDRQGGTFILGTGPQAARLLLSDKSRRATSVVPIVPLGPPMSFAPTQSVLFRSPQRGALDLVSTFASSDWGTGDFRVEPIHGPAGQVAGQYINLGSSKQQIALLHNNGTSRLAAYGMATDGQFLSRQTSSSGQMTLCYRGGTTIETPLRQKVNKVLDRQDRKPLVPGSAWSWKDGQFVFHPPSSNQARCVTFE